MESSIGILLVASLFLGGGNAAQAGKDAAAEKAKLNREMTDLAKELEKPEAKIEELVLGFAAKRRPEKGSVEFLSGDKSLQIVLGANGSEANPDAPTVNLSPKGGKFSFGIGGNGFDSNSGDGGAGGTVIQKAKAPSDASKVYLFGGSGGKGYVKHKGGRGGNVYFGSFTHALAKGGPGGPAGTGGAGGDGGEAGPSPTKH